jgi:hypothetical protein
MNRQEIDFYALKYHKVVNRLSRKKYMNKLIEIFKPFLMNKAWKLKRQTTDPSISVEDIYQDLVINFIDTLKEWNPKRKCSFKTYLIWHNQGNPIRARRRGGINYLFRKDRKVYLFTDFDSWAKKNGHIDCGDGEDKRTVCLAYYKMCK